MCVAPLLDGGVGFTTTGPGNGFTILQEGSTWTGEYPAGTPLLFDNNVSGTVTLTFAQGISGITDLAVQANAYGAYTATLSAYNGATFSARRPTTDLMK